MREWGQARSALKKDEYKSSHFRPLLKRSEDMPKPKTTPRAIVSSHGGASKEARADGLHPRKLPRQERAAATVAAILEAAAVILETGGFDAYTTNAIAERAGASIGSLYQYFPNKNALTRALIAREDSALLRELVQLLERPQGSGRLSELIHIAVSHQLRRPVLARLLDVEEARLPPGDEARHLDDIRTSIFRHCLGEELIAREPYVMQDLFAIIHGMVDAAGQRGEGDMKVLAKRVERAVSGYLGTFPPATAKG
jgi:AcrR family transcriptional regulator